MRAAFAVDTSSRSLPGNRQTTRSIRGRTAKTTPAASNSRGFDPAEFVLFSQRTANGNRPLQKFLRD